MAKYMFDAYTLTFGQISRVAAEVTASTTAFERCFIIVSLKTDETFQ